MSSEAAFVFGVIVVAAVLMASNRVRFDIVALLVVMALMLSGVLSIGEALAGFGSSVVALVAGLLVIGEMLARTGVARAVGDWMAWFRRYVVSCVIWTAANLVVLGVIAGLTG